MAASWCFAQTHGTNNAKASAASSAIMAVQTCQSKQFNNHIRVSKNLILMLNQGTLGVEAPDP